MSNLSFKNIDTTALREKLVKLDDIESRINILLSKINAEDLKELKPSDFYLSSNEMKNTDENDKHTPLNDKEKNNNLLDARLSSLINNEMYNIDMNFSTEANDLIVKIKDARNKIDYADSTPTPSIVSSIPTSNELVTAITGEASGELEETSNDEKENDILSIEGETTYKLQNGIILKLPNDKEIYIQSGYYEITNQNDDGTSIIALNIDGYNVRIVINQNNEVLRIEVIGLNDINYVVESTEVYKLSNKESIIVGTGTYQILKVCYDIDGNITSITILCNGKEITLLVKNGQVVEVIDVSNAELALNESMSMYVDGKIINLLKGIYKTERYIYDDKGNIIGIVIKKDDKLITLQMENGKVVGILSIEVIGLNDINYAVESTEVYKLSNKEDITIEKGTYQILKICYDANGNITSITILCSGKEITLIVKNGQIVEVIDVTNAELALSESMGMYVDGKIINLLKGTYKIERYIYDDKGDVVGIVIKRDDKLITLQMENGKVVGILSIENIDYIINENGVVQNNNGVILVKVPEDYEINNYIKDKDGNIVAVILKNHNGELVIVRVIDGQVVGLDNKNENFYLSERLELILPDKTKLLLDVGTYQIIDSIYGKNGLEAVCVTKDNLKIWIYLDSNGKVIKLEYIKTINGVFTVNELEFYNVDKYGNQISLLGKGEYYIYEVRYDVNGNVIAIRISPNNEYELWVYLDDDNKNANYLLFDDEIISDDTKSKLSLFKKNKSLLGLLGILFVGLGGALILRKKKKDKIEYESLEEGNYPVYEVKEEDGKTLARINNAEDDEYWAEM